MSERLPAAGPVGTGAHPPDESGAAPECHAWFPALAAAAARPSRPPFASRSLTTTLDHAAPPFAPAGAIPCDGTPAEIAALRAAAACPDVYLIDAAAGDQLRLAADLARACRQRGERVVLLTAESIDADKLVVRLRDAGEASLLRALGAGEPANQLPTASAERVGRVHGEVAVQQARAKLQAAARESAARVTALEADAAPAGDRLTGLRAERDRHATPLAPSPRLAEVAAELDAVAQSHAQAVAELAALNAQHQAAEAKKPAGWIASVKRLFAPDEAAPVAPPALAARVADFEGRVAALRREADQLRSAGAEAEAARAQALSELEAQVRRAEAERDAAHADHAARLADARAQVDRDAASLRQFEADAPTLARRLIDAAAVVVGPASALRGDAALHAPARFDVAILTDAELLGDAELHATDLVAGRRVLLGDATPAHPPGYRNGRTPPAGPFARLLHRHHAPGLHVDRGQMTAQLLPVPADAALHCEALADQPEVELRFLRAGGLLAQVVFPANSAVAAAKGFLARELGAHFLRFAAPPDWRETDEAVEARVPAAAAGDRVELGDGLTEETADGWTVAVRFDKSHGWTLASSQARLADLAPTPRSARQPRPPKAPESAPARRPAGVRG